MVERSNFSAKASKDLEIVEQALLGNEKAFAQLLDRYQDPIYFLLLKKIGNENDAEDLTMETFAKAFNNLDKYTPDYAFSTWLFRIAINNCIDFVRKVKVRPQSIDTTAEYQDADNPNFTSPNLNPEDLLIKKQKSKDLKSIILTLKPRYATLIDLRYYQELTYEEIAQELHLPIGTVKAQLYRARELLAPLLTNKYK
ncbi:MAG TPA: sigma-70 family RNA polymerase sigma factor [Bacteroidales bacterium]|nr:sigma-70 family RNA polymerase sigma factor [Bacteroidales bacterium]HOR60025.1 sigma-70 family RNA polymerase sigma factor [Bacteroidales bacterium]HPL04377.1 sigma-70 family RNA polymerase sigma factor [Bacteroidales bacterium]